MKFNIHGSCEYTFTLYPLKTIHLWFKTTILYYNNHKHIWVHFKTLFGRFGSRNLTEWTNSFYKCLYELKKNPLQGLYNYTKRFWVSIDDPEVCSSQTRKNEMLFCYRGHIELWKWIEIIALGISNYYIPHYATVSFFRMEMIHFDIFK